jgi:hypothetical protein
LDLQYQPAKGHRLLRTAVFLLGSFSASLALADSSEGIVSPIEAPTSQVEPQCLDLAQAIMSIASEVEAVELERALETSIAAVDALECQPEPVQPVLLTALLQMVGAVQLYSGDEASAKDAFAWAATTSPSTPLSPTYGQDAVELYQAEQTRIFDAEPAKLEVMGDVEAWIDGALLMVGQHQNLTPGKHLVQWRLDNEPIQARVIELMAGEDRGLRLGPGGSVPETLLTVPVVETPPISRLATPGQVLFLGTGLASITGGTVLVVLASRSHDRFYEEQDPEDLPELQTRTNSLAATGLVLMASGIAVGSFSITLGSGLSVSGSF